MKQGILITAIGLACLAGGWFLGRVRSESTEPGEFAIPKTPESGPTLKRRVHGLWKADANQCDGRQVLRFLRYLAENFDDDAWWAACGPIWHALDQQRSIDSLQDAVFLANEAIVPRFVMSGSSDELLWLIQRGNSGAFDAGQINFILEKAAGQPIPPQGYAGSPQEALVCAAIRAGDFSRARDYLSKIAFGKDAPAEARAPAEALREVTEIGLQAASGKADFRRLVAAWRGQLGSPLGRSCLQPALENVVLSAFTELDRRPTLPSVDSLFKGSASEDGSERFWERILFRMQPTLVRGQEILTLETGGLVDAFAALYRRADYGYRYWMRMVELSWRWSADNPARTVGFCRRALAAATSDRDRVNALRLLAYHAERAIEPEAALRTVEETAGSIQDVVFKKELALLSEELRQSVAKAKSSSLPKKRAEGERQIKMLRRTRELLLQARKDNRPPEEIASLQELVRELEAGLKE